MTDSHLFKKRFCPYHQNPMYYTFFFCLLTCLLVQHDAFSFFAKISSFIKRGISFQILGCVFVPELCVVL